MAATTATSKAATTTAWRADWDGIGPVGDAAREASDITDNARGHIGSTVHHGSREVSTRDLWQVYRRPAAWTRNRGWGRGTSCWYRAATGTVSGAESWVITRPPGRDEDWCAGKGSFGLIVEFLVQHGPFERVLVLSALNLRRLRCFHCSPGFGDDVFIISNRFFLAKAFHLI